MALDLPPHLSHTAVVLATHWPNMWPGQRRLAAEMHVARSTLNDRLRELEDRGVVVRIRREDATTAYRLRFRGVRSTGKHVRPTLPEEQINGPNLGPDGDWDDTSKWA